MRKIFLPPVVLTLCLIAIGTVNHAGLATHIFLTPPFSYGGTVLILFGICFPLWATVLFRRHQTNILPYKAPDKMVISGPFRLSRNPMYLGMFSVIMGVALLYGTTLSIIFPLIFFLVANRWYIPFEEARMQDAFGDEFLAYKAAVRRWL